VERRRAGLIFRIACGGGQQHADASYSLALLRARRHRPRHGAAEQRNDLAPSQTIE
jgi:hypothetical protein